MSACAYRAIYVVPACTQIQRIEHILVKYRGVSIGRNCACGRAHWLPRGEVKLSKAAGIDIWIHHVVEFI